ncbi:MAG TPA: outer membrane beta-barrel protein [Candidatus Polarisedimenticolia bacterium]|nr:outer membrane beta-barrel protein [Candidatus Polarisedimenticolia bacterium]
MILTMTRAMKSPLLPALVIALLAAGGPVLAQGRTVAAPRGGDMAVSGNLGVVNAFDDDFDDFEPIFTGTFEYYTSPRVSWRGLLGFTEFDGRFGDIDYKFVNANIVYNWEGDSVHPYVTGGVGAYFKDANGRFLPSDSDDTEIGLNGGGGLDILLTDQWAIKVEGVFHGLTGAEPDAFFAATAGAKFWF